MKGLSGAVMSFLLGVWVNLSLLMAGSWSSCGDGCMGQPRQPILLQETRGNRQWGTCGVSTEAGAEESLSAGRKGLSEVWQHLCSVYFNRLPAVLEEVKDNIAEWRQGRPFSDPIQSEDVVEL